MDFIAVLFWSVFCACSTCGTNHFAVHIKGKEDDARSVAFDYNFNYKGKLFSDGYIYHFQHHNITCNKKSEKIMSDLKHILEDERVLAVYPQTPQYRYKRTGHFLLDDDTTLRSEVSASSNDESFNVDLNFNDPFYSAQWYLHGNSTEEHDLNVEPVWRMGYTGEGVVLSVLDDGLLYSNMDIQPNYEPSVSCDLTNLEAQNVDPRPNITSPDSSHGTYCAAIVAAAANNSYCGVGVAYDAKVGGVRLLDGPVTDLQESLALSYGLDNVNIYSASWGPRDDGKQVDGPKKLAIEAFKRGVTKGRNGRGVIYVWAVGNGGHLGDNCNLDGYASSIYTLSVNSLTAKGLSTFYDEPCTSTLASVYVGGKHTNTGIGRERNTRKLSVVVPELNGECRDSFQGTSAAAPMAAGIIALVLQANPNLTWRDVQHIVVQTAAKTNDSGWQTNGADLHFHLVYGFGSLNALKMVNAALKWKNVPMHRNYTIHVSNLPREFLKDTTTYLSVTVPEFVPMDYAEHVVVTVNLSHEKRGQVEMFVISPAGTSSQILTQRRNDLQTDGFKNWDFVSVNFWGEGISGIWQLKIVNHSDLNGRLKSAKFTFFGFCRSEC